MWRRSFIFTLFIFSGLISRLLNLWLSCCGRGGWLSRADISLHLCLGFLASLFLLKAGILLESLGRNLLGEAKRHLLDKTLPWVGFFGLVHLLFDLWIEPLFAHSFLGQGRVLKLILCNLEHGDLNTIVLFIDPFVSIAPA